MTTPRRPSKKSIEATIFACIENGSRLLEETYDLEFRDPPSTRLYLSMIAQEEFAKAFLLFLVKEQVIEFSGHILRAMNDHACKQLVGIVLDYVIFHWDDVEDLKSMISRDSDLGENLPDDVGSAIEILRYEKIGRWEENNWIWTEDPKYDRSMLKISEGAKDKKKQNSLYVRVGRDGRATSTPKTITKVESNDEFERARRYHLFIISVSQSEIKDHYFDKDRYQKIVSAMRTLFQHNV